MSPASLAELRRPALWAIAVVFGAITMMWTTYNEYVPEFLGTTFGVPALVITLLLTLDSVLGFFLEPLIGLVSDRTRTAWGKRLPWLMLALPIGAVAFALIPLPLQFLPANPSPNATAQAYSPFVFAVVGMIAAMAITRTPTISLMPDLITPPQRAVAHGLIQTWAGLGALGALYSGTWLIDNFGVAAPFWVSSGVMVVSLAWLWLLLHRHRDTAAESAPAATTSNGASQWRWVVVVGLLWLGYIAVVNQLSLSLGVNEAQDALLQNLWTILFAIAALPCGLMQDSTRAVQIGIGVLIAVVALLLLAPANLYLYALLMGAGGIGWALVTVHSLPLLLNAGAAGKNGRNTGLYYLAFALAGVAGPWLLRGVEPLMGGATLWFAPLVWLIALVLVAVRINSVQGYSHDSSRTA